MNDNAINNNQEAINALLRGIQQMVNEAMADCTKIYNGLVTSITNGYTIKLNGESYKLDAYGDGEVKVNDMVKVFVPQNNMNLAFFLPKNSKPLPEPEEE